jgi:hypothetical protein
MLGEVDCGFLIWYRAQKYRVSVEDQLDESFRNYAAFLDEIRERGRYQVIIAAVPPPTLLDGQVWGDVADARKEIHASLAERTELTKVYNERLRGWTQRTGRSFLDYEADVLDPSTGLVRSNLRNPDPLDHHLDPAKFARVLAVGLHRLGIGAQPPHS